MIIFKIQNKVDIKIKYYDHKHILNSLKNLTIKIGSYFMSTLIEISDGRNLSKSSKLDLMQHDLPKTVK